MTVCLAGAFEPRAMALLRDSQGAPMFGFGSAKAARGEGGQDEADKVSLCFTWIQPLSRRF